MSLIALTSAKGSPGVTTAALALALTWPLGSPGGRVLVLDADMAGGDIAAGYLRGAVSAADGILGLVSDRGPEITESVWSRSIALDEHGARLVLTGISDPAQARSLGTLWTTLAAALSAGAHERDTVTDVIVDLGRVGTVGEATALRQAADLVLLVTRSSLPAVASAHWAARRLREERTTAGGDAATVACLLVGESDPYCAAEIADAIELPVMGALAWDPASAGVLSVGAPASWRFTRSALMRSARSVAATLHAATVRPASTSVRLDATDRPVTSVLAANEARLREVAP